MDIATPPLPFSVFQWNLLAEGLEYGHPKWGFPKSATSRSNSCLTRLLESGADFICLQEVTQKMFVDVQSFLKPYKGDHLMKTYGAGASPDGVALFWRDEEYELVDKQPLSRVNMWNQVCLCILLKHRKTGVCFGIAGTHLKAYQTPAEEKTRSKQATTFVTMFQEWLNSRAAVSLFIGDLNSSLTETPDRIGWEGQALQALEAEGYVNSYLAFPWTDGLNPNHFITFCDKGEKELYDYIFFKKHRPSDLFVTFAQPLPDFNTSQPIGGDSDHLPVFCKYALHNK